jgi:hypothetical protein
VEQQQETVSQEVQLAQRLQTVEDRLILASLPILTTCLILWAIAFAYPDLATIVNLIITILVVLVSSVVMIRLVETAWRWLEESSDDSPNSTGAGLIGFLLLLGVWGLIDMVIHAGVASLSHYLMVGGLLLILGVQYRAIIMRWMRK